MKTNHNKRIFYQLPIAFIGVPIALMIAMTILCSTVFPGQALTPMSLSSQEICQIITAMPKAENTDKLLSVLGTSRSNITKNLIAMKGNMEQYEAEGYGWQNALDSASGLEPRPSSWLIGALRMACES
ncbi:hypothetical protein [Crocosphaera chwakensis]|uniref:Uncharacterized protein n=1 Tax=Crocosphaera chwakensis CCY0110 TaxID=391612 RepID=A3IY04_9CHRO|nr:hypothetical protein [Crocosphaera chwakensis]EAZ88632.1 hypothetical protein CY0110_12467 [Crocosphaera chwakensis CCY0110]